MAGCQLHGGGKCACAVRMAVCILLTASLALAKNQGTLSSSKRMLSQLLNKASLVGDPYNMLRQESRSIWNKDPGLRINETIQQLSNIPVRLTIEVRLVGFGGNGHLRMNVGPHTLLDYLHALRAEMETVILDPQLESLPVRPKFNWVVTEGTVQLADAVTAAISSAGVVASDQANTRPHGKMPGDPLLLPYQCVDDVLQHDVLEDINAAFTLYILNPAAYEKIGKYAYSYGGGGEEEAGWCAGTHWATSSRTVWVDITAGPLTYGPGAGLKGHVFDHTLPHPRHFKPTTLPASLLPYLASLSWSAVQHFAWPPMQLAAEYKKQLTVQVIHLHDTLGPPMDKVDEKALQGALHAALGDQQAVTVHENFVSMASCPLCVDAFTSSLKVQTARDMTSSLIETQNRQVLDPQVLHRLLARYQGSIYGTAGIHMDFNSSHRQLSVFVINVSQEDEPLLFLGGARVVAFNDMVLAVVSKAGLYHDTASCGYMHVVANSAAITRDVLAGVLTAGWGLANTSTFYIPASGLGTNHLWSVGATPFGSLSSATHVPGPLAAMMPRNLVLSHLKVNSERLQRVLRGFARLSRNGRFDSYAVGGHKRDVIKRVNLALYKVQEAAIAMSRADYWQALKYARSLAHESLALEKLALELSRETGSRLQCSTGPTLATVWWAPVSALLLWPVASFLRKRVFKPKLHKEF